MHRLFIVMLCCVGCRSASPFAAGEPLLPAVVESLEQQRQLPDYLVPADSLTAHVVRPFARERGIAMTAPEAGIHCPWSGRTPTGYRVRITIDSIVGDVTTANYRVSCSSPTLRSPFATGGRAELRRSGKTWVLVKWLDRWIT